MGDRYYNPNQYNPFMAQPKQPVSNFFDMRTPHPTGFSVNTSMPVYNSPASYNQAQNSSTLCRPPPSYGESQSHTPSRLETNTTCPPAWSHTTNTGPEKQHSQRNNFLNLFDIPGQTETNKNSSEWSSDNYNSSQNYQGTPPPLGFPQGSSNPPNNFSQQPSTNFSSDYQSEYSFLQNSVISERQSNEFRHTNNRGYGKHNQNRGKGKGGFRGRQKGRDFDRQNRGRSRDGGSWTVGRDRFGDKNDSNQPQVNSNQEEVGNVLFKHEEHGSDGEGNEDDRGNGDERDYENQKVNVFIPDFPTVTKYEYYPPSPEEMGEMFKDLVIHFFFKTIKNKKEQNPFVIICEAFRRSAGYSNLEVEDGYDIKVKDRKFCTLRYNGMMMVRGVGENNCIKEARVVAAVELINKLAMTCYTLESKPEYFTVKAFERMLQDGDSSGLYCFAPTEEVYDFETARTYLKSSFEEDSDVEHIFHFPNVKHANRLKGWANKQGFESRVIKDEWLGVWRHRTTQYWRDKLLASGVWETAKFILKPPQGIGNLLMSDFDIKDAIVQLKARPRPKVCTLPNVYGPPGVGPEISKALPPWERRGGSVKNKKSRQKEKKILDMVKQGVPLTETKGFKYLSRRKKQKLKEKLGQV